MSFRSYQRLFREIGIPYIATLLLLVYVTNEVLFSLFQRGLGLYDN